MPFDKSLYTRAPKPHDESRFEYHGVAFTHDQVRTLPGADDMALAQARKKLPGGSAGWTLDYILVTGNPIDPNVSPLTRTFVFRKPRPGVGAGG